MRRYLLGDLIRDRLVRCVFGRRDGRIVSHLLYTPYPNTYKSDGRKRHRVHLCLITLQNLIFKPRRLENLRNLFRRRYGPPGAARPSVYPNFTADVLFLAVVSPHGKWIPPGGASRLTLRLFEEMVADLRRLGIREVFIAVNANNERSNRFFSSCGCYKVEEATAHNGEVWRHYLYRVTT